MTLGKISDKDMRHCHFLKSICDIGGPHQGPHDCRDYVHTTPVPGQSEGIEPTLCTDHVGLEITVDLRIAWPFSRLSIIIYGRKNGLFAAILLILVLSTNN